MYLMLGRFLLVAGALVLAACNREPPPPAASPARETSSPSPSPSPPAPSAAAPSDSAPVVHPQTCEVEFAGNLQLPPGAPRGDANYVFVTIGDCLAEGARVVGWGGNTNGRFFVEVFVPWGSDVSLCAVSMAPPGKPSTLYGKTPLLHAEKLGDVEFKNLVVPLKSGPPRLFPRPPGR
jgi:hypothetical protein